MPASIRRLFEAAVTARPEAIYPNYAAAGLKNMSPKKRTGVLTLKASLPRTAKAAVVLMLMTLLFGREPAQAHDELWVGSWMASPQPSWGKEFVFPTRLPASLKDQTLRQVVRISLGGRRMRLVFSNTYSRLPLRIGAATIGVAGKSSVLAAGTIHKVTFGGEDVVVIPPGASGISDPVEMPVDSETRLSISVYLPDETPLTTLHWDARQTSWLGNRDQTRTTAFLTATTTQARAFLSEVLVDGPNAGAVVVLGDSITDGAGATVDADERWPDFLARRLAARHVAVLNAGISGARMLQDKMGVNAAARLDSDVLSQPQLKAIIILIGINDIAWPGTAFAPSTSRPTAADLVVGYQQLVAEAHAHNVRVIGATMTPFNGALSGTQFGDYYSPQKDALRRDVNNWIRTSGVFDAVVDFDAALRDPVDTTRIAPAYDSGDHLHPGGKGNRAMADAVDLDTLLSDAGRLATTSVVRTGRVSRE